MLRNNDFDYFFHWNQYKISGEIREFLKELSAEWFILDVNRQHAEYIHLNSIDWIETFKWITNKDECNWNDTNIKDLKTRKYHKKFIGSVANI